MAPAEARHPQWGSIRNMLESSQSRWWLGALEPCCCAPLFQLRCAVQNTCLLRVVLQAKTVVAW